MNNTLRLFIAIDTPPEIKQQIGTIRDKLKESGADVKWEPDEKLHATIKFLGSTEDHLLPEIVSCIEGIAKTTVQLGYAGVGCFPNKRNPKVIWVGIEDINGSLVAMQQALENAFVPLGFQREDRKFHPHLTIGRVKGKGGSLLRTMESVTFESQPVTIREVALIKSELKPNGSQYTILKSIPLNT